MNTTGMNSLAKTTCKDVIAKCDRAIAAQKEQVKIRDEIIEKSKELIIVQQEQLDGEKKLCKNPFVTGSVAASAGAIAVLVNPISLLIGGGLIALSCLVKS